MWRNLFSLGVSLFCIGSCLDRLKAKGINENDYEKAFRGAYNTQKHSISLVDFQYYKKGGITFPIRDSLFEIPASMYYFDRLPENVISQKKSNKKI